MSQRRVLGKFARAGVVIGISHLRHLRGRLISESTLLAKIFAPRIPDELTLRMIFRPEDLFFGCCTSSISELDSFMHHRFTILGKTAQFGRIIDWHADFNGGCWPTLFAWNYNRIPSAARKSFTGTFSPERAKLAAQEMLKYVFKPDRSKARHASKT